MIYLPTYVQSSLEAKIIKNVGRFYLGNKANKLYNYFL